MPERRFRRDFTSLDAIFAFVREFLKTHGWIERHAPSLELIAEELFTNLVKYNRDGTEDIAIQLEWHPPEVILTLRDFGVEAWDLTRVPPVDTTVPVEKRRAGGLGLHLVRQIADRIDYAYENRNSTITVTKRLEP